MKDDGSDLDPDSGWIDWILFSLMVTTALAALAAWTSHYAVCLG